MLVNVISFFWEGLLLYVGTGLWEFAPIQTGASVRSGRDVEAWLTVSIHPKDVQSDPFELFSTR